MSLRSPLRRVLGLGSAKEGAAHWLAQRLTAVALAVLGAWFIAALVRLDGLEFARVHGWLSSPLSAALLLALVGALAWHLSLGLQVVIEDYVGSRAWRLAWLVGVKFACVLAALAGAIAVLRIATGAAA